MEESSDACPKQLFFVLALLLSTLLILQLESSADPGDVMFMIPNPNAGVVDNFGDSLDAAGDNILISAQNITEGTLTQTGIAYLFSGENGELLNTFRHPHPRLGFESYGRAVAGAGNRLAIASNPGGGTIQDPAEVFFYNGTGAPFGQTDRIASPNDPVFDFFGKSLAGRPGELLVGAPNFAPAEATGGHAHLFTTAKGPPAQTFDNPVPDEIDGFGEEVAFVGNKVAIGAPFSDRNETNLSGAVCIFNAGDGTFLRTLDNPRPGRNDRFGFTLASLGDDLLLVGVPFESFLTANPQRPNFGEVYLFDCTTGEVVDNNTQTDAAIANPVPDNNSLFGVSLVGYGNLGVAAIGAPGADGGNGAVYFVNVDPSHDDFGLMVKKIPNPNPPIGGTFGNVMARFGDNLIVNGGLSNVVYVLEGPGPLEGGNGEANPDFTGDGMVNALDLVEFLENFPSAK